MITLSRARLLTSVLAVGAVWAFPAVALGAPPSPIELRVVTTAGPDSLPQRHSSGPTSVAPGSSYTVAVDGCGTGWAVSLELQAGRPPFAGLVTTPNPEASTQQSDTGAVITRTVPADVPSTPKYFQNYVIQYTESLVITCTRGDEVARGQSYVYVERVDDFVRWEPIFVPHATVAWQIYSTVCPDGATATLDATSNKRSVTLTTTITNSGFAIFPNEQLDYLDFAFDPSAQFVVTCDGADGPHSITLLSNAVAAIGGSTNEPVGALPGVGGRPVGGLLAIGSGVTLLGLVLRRVSSSAMQRNTPR